MNCRAKQLLGEIRQMFMVEGVPPDTRTLLKKLEGLERRILYPDQGSDTADIFFVQGIHAAYHVLRCALDNDDQVKARREAAIADPALGRIAAEESAAAARFTPKENLGSQFGDPAKQRFIEGK